MSDLFNSEILDLKERYRLVSLISSPLPLAETIGVDVVHDLSRVSDPESTSFALTRRKNRSTVSAAPE